VFQGFEPAALEFFEGLEADNSKAYWTTHREVWESAVRAPMADLTAELAPSWGRVTVFRPYRDVRFSADKSPYKTHHGAVVGDGYVQVSAEGLACGSGMYTMTRNQLSRFRAAVADDYPGTRLAGIVAALAEQGIETVSQSQVRTAPRGYPADHPRIALLRRTSLAAWRAWPPEPWLGTREVVARVSAFFAACRPLDEWLHAHVGPSEPGDPEPGDAPA